MAVPLRASEREYAHDRHTEFDKLDVAVGAAAVNQRTVVDMKTDRKVVFAFELK